MKGPQICVDGIDLASAVARVPDVVFIYVHSFIVYITTREKGLHTIVLCGAVPKAEMKPFSQAHSLATKLQSIIGK